MSRKLVFTSGLLRAFFCQIDRNAATGRERLRIDNDPRGLLDYLEPELAVTPLELLDRAASRPAVPLNTARKLFNSYDEFLCILDDDRRIALERLQFSEMATSDVWRQLREVSHEFQNGLTELFYGEDEELNRLIVSFGVF